jgi:hypothetical protein
MDDSSIPPPGRALASTSGLTVPGRPARKFQRAAGALHMALHVGQRFLPPPYDNIASTVSKLLGAHLQPPPPAPPVNLAPMEDGLAELQAEHRDLHSQVREQNAALKRVEDQLEIVSQATDSNAVAQQEQSAVLKRVEDQLELVSQANDQNALVQQELMEGLKGVSSKLEELRAVGRRAKILALVALGLLAASIALNVILLLHFRSILP